jgi:hypothetical protein
MIQHRLSILNDSKIWTTFTEHITYNLNKSVACSTIIFMISIMYLSCHELRIKLLSAFAKLWKSITSFIYLSVRTPARPEQLGTHWAHFYKIWYLSVFGKPVLKIQVSLKSDSKGKGLPQQAELAQGVPGRLRPRNFLTFGTTRVVGRQP